ncbi:retropepsin-like domain-containing protein [Myxococcota bacterium]|nr:retropepsin-like domain-containing protein [Myxococcota bacterium]MBU1899837.1 retropepsin-like domain-containing protein [Myxococcota bacterium]
MRAPTAWALTLLLLSCGAPPSPWPTPLAGAYEIPLFMAVETPWVLVEARIEGGAPLLLMLDPRTRRGALTREALSRAGLRPRGALDPATVEIPCLDLGGLRLSGLRFGVIGPLGRVHGRPLDGILGWDLFADRLIEIDPGAGALRVLSWAPPLPASAVRLPVTLEGERWIYTAEAAGVTRRLEIALGAPLSGALGATPLALTGPGLRPDLTLVPLEGGFGADGLLNYGAFAPVTLRFDGRRGRLDAWPSHPRSPMSRFEALAPCEEGGCLRGDVERVRPGRVDLRLYAEVATPAGFWMRVDFGQGAPRTALVRLNAAEARLMIADPSISPQVIRPIGAAIEVIDAVPLALPCAGDACIR